MVLLISSKANNMKTEHQKHDIHHRKLSSEIIAENVSRFILNHGSVILISAAVIIIFITGILIFNATISGADSKTNILLEEGIAAYMRAPSAQTAEEATSLMAIAGERFREVIKNAKGKKLKLRATYQLASLSFDMENYREASRLFKEVSDNRNFYLAEPSLYSRAISLIQLKEYKEARETLETLIKLYPKSYMNPQATFELANVYKAEGDSAKSLDTLKNWVKNNPEDTVYQRLFNETIALMESKIY